MKPDERRADILVQPPGDDVSIRKFDILASSTCARALLGGPARDETKERRLVAGITGPRAGRNTPSIC
jgi:hypothetical protein